MYHEPSKVDIKRE